MKTPAHRLLAIALGLCLATHAANAHEIWIEPLTTGQLVVRFAEFGEDFEVSPCKLDSLTLPDSWKVEAEGGVTKLVVQKAADHFALVDATARMSVQAETIFEVIGGKPGARAIKPDRPAGPSSMRVGMCLALDLRSLR